MLWYTKDGAPALLVTAGGVATSVRSATRMCSIPTCPDFPNCPIPQGLCHCGCERSTTVPVKSDSRSGRVAGEPVRYLRGHQFRKHRDLEPDRLCACGCGGVVPRASQTRTAYGLVQGQPIRYIKGHYPRTLRKSTVEYVEQPGPLPTPCWVWQRATQGDGYGCLWYQRKYHLAHVVYYERAFGPVPKKKELHHRCENKGCVNPYHLTPVTSVEHHGYHDRRISDDDVRAIRSMGDVPTTVIMELFHITRAYANRIRKGTSPSRVVI